MLDMNIILVYLIYIYLSYCLQIKPNDMLVFTFWKGEKDSHYVYFPTSYKA